MNDKDIKIIEKIYKAKKAYYKTGNAIMSDQEYDSLEEYIRQKYPNHPLFEEVGHSPSSYWSTEKHNIPMGSLDKVHNEEDMRKWAKKYYGSLFILQWKLDGLSLSLNYENSEFIRALTRGDGFEGEDISDNVMLMQNFKRKIPGFSGSIRAEILLFKEDFNNINLVLPEDKKYSNPRNAASGISRRLDGKFCKYLHLIYYDIMDSIDEHEKIKKLKELDLETVESFTDNEFDKIVQTFYTLRDIRPDLPFGIDGAVVKVSSYDIQQKEGSSRNRPKAQKAWKFDPPGAATEFIKVEWDVGRTGVLTPLAHLDPIEIDGSTIRKATLHNVAEIKRLGIGRGDIVMLTKRGDIIPKITSVIESKGQPITIPVECPSCGYKLLNDGKRLICQNDECSRKNFFRTLNWIKVTEIDNFGESLANELYNTGKLQSIADIYRLNRYDIKELDRWGDKSADLIIKNIEKTKILSSVKFLSALGVPTISERTSKELIKHFGSIPKLMEADIENIKKLKGFSDISAEKIVLGLLKHKKEIEYLLSIIEIKEEDSEGPLSNQSFCFTGAMKYPRNFYQDLVKKYGGDSKSTVTKDLTYLVCNDDRGSNKSKKAKEHGVKTINEDEFISLLPSNCMPKKTKRVINYPLFDDEG